MYKRQLPAGSPSCLLLLSSIHKPQVSTVLSVLCSAKPQLRSSHPRDIHKPQLKAYFGWGFTLCIAHVQPGFPQSCTAQADRPPWGHVDNSPVLPGLPCSMGIFGHYSVVIHKRRRRLQPIVRQKCGVNWGNIELCTARAA